MGKPDRAIFEQWFSAESATPALRHYEELILNYALVTNPLADPETWIKISEKLGLADETYDAMWTESKVSPAAVWAKSQPGYVRAREILWPRKKAKGNQLPANANWINHQIERLQKRSHGGLTVLQSSFSQTLAHSWQSSAFHALYEYFYQDHATQMYALARNGPPALLSIATSIDEVLLPLLNALPEHRNSVFANRLERMLRYLEDDEIFNSLPIKRNTLHKAEQLFVYRLWRANMQYTGKPKPEAIAELMTLDGFDRQFDERTIERMCARFKTAKLEAIARRSAGAKKTAIAPKDATT